MLNIAEFQSEVFKVDESTFSAKALAVFEFQAKNNPVYRNFLHYLDIHLSTICRIEDIPFLPITLFKNQKVICDGYSTDFYFESSGTGNMERSKHFVPDTDLYIRSFLTGINLAYSDISQYCIAALLPSYLEREHASLVYMCNHLINNSKQPGSGFFLNEFENLTQLIRHNEAQQIPTMVIGVSFALLDLADYFQMPLKHTLIMETGGMKGRRTELTRPELHDYLRRAFGPNAIHSEYGMTELLSQAYAKRNGYFFTPPWMKVFIRDTEDPLSLINNGKTGCINIIDLANIYSCSFIATQDLGKVNSDGSFEVLGRFDNSDVRGCNLLVN